MSDAWVSPGERGQPPTAPTAPAASVPTGWPDGGPAERPRRAGRGLAVVSVVLAVAAYVVLVVGILTVLLALVAPLVAGAVAAVALLCALASVVVLAVQARRRRVRGAVVTLLVVVAGGALSGVLLDSLVLAPGREHRARQTAAATAERQLPATASPVEVVDFAYRLDRLDEQDVFAPSEAMCGLLVPQYRDGCERSPSVSPPDEPPAYETVRDEGDRLIVTWTTEPFDERAAVRLQRGPRGWELVDVPDRRPDDCVVRALSTGYEAWSCPPQGG